MKVLVTRSRHQGGALVELLARAGHEVVWWPLVTFSSPNEVAEISRLHRLATLFSEQREQWLVCTSVNAVQSFADYCYGQQLYIGSNVRAAAVGQGTAEAMTKTFELSNILVPQKQHARGLVDELLNQTFSRLVLWPHANNAQLLLRDALEQAGWTCDHAVSYRAIDLIPDESFSERGCEVICCTSSAMVHRLVRIAGVDDLCRWNTNGGLFISMGPATSKTICKMGMTVFAEAACPTIQDVVRAIPN